MATYSRLSFLASENAPPAARDLTPTVRIDPPRGRPSYDLSGYGFLSPWSRLQQNQPLQLYEKLREAVPVIDAAINRTIELVGCPCVKAADEETEEELSTWLWKTLCVNHVQQGAKPFIASYLDDMLTYGRAHAEIILTNRRDDVYALMPLHPATMGFRPQEDGYHMDTVQFGRLEPYLFPAWKVMNAVGRIKGDDPNGTSLLWGLPFVTEIYTSVFRSLGQTWTRFGTPSYAVIWKPPADFNDPQGTQSERIMGRMQTNFENALRSRVEGNIRDFYMSGDVGVSVIGAAGEQLEFATTEATLLDQIISKTGLPPFLLGITRSTTERMSVIQSSALREMVDNIQNALTPPLLQMIRLRQILRGFDPDVDLEWSSANLTDKLMEAQASEAEETARKLTLENDLAEARLGIWTMKDIAIKVRPELAGLDDAEFAAEVPNLLEEVPALPTPQPFGQPPGGQGPNGQDQGPGNNRPPQFRSVTYATNGNGRH